MFRPEEMTRVDVVVLEADLRAAITELGRLGCAHLVPAKSQESGELLQMLDIADSLSEAEILQSRVVALRGKLGIKLRGASRPPGAVSPAEMKQRLAPLEEQVNALCGERDKAVEAAAALRKDEEALKNLSSLPLEAFSPERLSFVTIRVGWLKREPAERLTAEADFAIVVTLESRKDEQLIAVLAPRKKRFALQTILENLGLTQQAAPDTKGADPAVALARSRESRLALLSSIQGLQGKLAEIAGSVEDKLNGYYDSLATEIAMFGAMANFGRTKFTCVAAGWVPTVDTAVFSDRLLAATGNRAYVRMRRVPFTDSAEAGIPVKARLNAFFRPFRHLLVSNFGLPTYGEIEPTPIVAISFLVLFGLMFGDLGQGAVLVLAGLLLRWKSSREVVRDFGFIFITAGISAMFFGTFMYGSVFGKGGALPDITGMLIAPLEQTQPVAQVNQVMRLFLIAIVAGIILLSTGVVLNILNSFSRKAYYRGALDKFGLVGLIFYWGVLALTIYGAVYGSVPAWVILAFVGLPLLLIFLAEPLHALLSGGKKGTGMGTKLFESTVELMETVIMYLANTTSFLRIAAFSLAHAGLCFAMWTMYESLTEMAIPIVPWLVVILGNLLVIALEGLVAGIQCIRLEYYEFFGKFFRGEGKAFQPFKLGAREKQ